MSTEKSASAESIISDHDAYMAPNYKRYPIVMDRGSGCEVWDASGKRYLDLFAGFGGPLLGHAHPELVAAVSEQAARLWHGGPHRATNFATRSFGTARN